MSEKFLKNGIYLLNHEDKFKYAVVLDIIENFNDDKVTYLTYEFNTDEIKINNQIQNTLENIIVKNKYDIKKYHEYQEIEFEIKIDAYVGKCKVSICEKFLQFLNQWFDELEMLANVY